MTPSPVMDTMLPRRCQALTMRILCSGDTRAYTEIFSRRQSERLIVLGYLHAFLVVFGLLHIEYAPPTSMFAWFQPADVRPELDLRLLMFSAMFFALAGVFEYGRMLKQDSSSIV